MNHLKKFINKGSKRTQVIKKNVLGSFAIKGISIIISLILVPLTIEVLDPLKYGIWLTIFSIVTWVTMMDIGLGNGFRNRFSEAIALDNKESAKNHIQTLYSSIGIISLLFLVILNLSSFFLNWNKILNLPDNFDENISLILLLVFNLFCLQLYTKNITTVLLANQKTSLSNLIVLISSILSLIGILIIKKLGLSSLFSISLVFMISPVIVYTITSFIIFSRSLYEYKPKLFKFPQKKSFKEIMNLGGKFFIIQITGIIMFSSANIIISQVLGPEEVTPYSISFKLFSVTQTCLTIIMTPFWSAITEANAKNDIEWIKKSIKKLITIWIFFSIGVLLLWLISPQIIKIWIGDKITISFMLLFQFALNAIIIGWLSPFVYYINGIGKIKLELYISVIQLVFTIPITLFILKNSGLGATAVILSTNLVLLIPAILLPIQYNKLIKNKATGIWNK